MTNLVYIDGSVVLVKDKLENGDTRIRQIDKEIIKDILKSVDYLPFLEELYDIIEFTKDTEAEERKSKK